MKPKPIRQRIREAFKPDADGYMEYPNLARLVFPEDQYPRAFNYQMNGGPPGCYMALSKALRLMGTYEKYKHGRRMVKLKEADE